MKNTGKDERQRKKTLTRQKQYPASIKYADFKTQDKKYLQPKTCNLTLGKKKASQCRSGQEEE